MKIRLNGFEFRRGWASRIRIPAVPSQRLMMLLLALCFGSSCAKDKSRVEDRAAAIDHEVILRAKEDIERGATTIDNERSLAIRLACTKHPIVECEEILESLASPKKLKH